MANARQVRQYIIRVGGKLLQDAKDETQFQGLNLESQAKRRAPVDTGKLRQSIQARPFDEGYAVMVTAGNISDNSKNYAAFMEFGTGAKVRIPRGFEKMAAQFKGKKARVGVRPQPYLIPSYIQVGREYLQNLRNLIKDYEMGR
jgi:hypothetical protein